MPALYSHTTRATGTVLTASIYNGDHQNHIDNGVPGQLDDYSSTVTQMQTTVDPGESGTESLATSLAGELERLRFAIKEIKTAIGLTSAQWYTTATGSVAVASGGTGATTAAGARTNLGLGTIATVNSPVPVTDGGTGATTASGARDGLGATAGVWGISVGGTGQTSAVAAFDALAPTTTKGDLIVHNGTDNIRVAVGTNGQMLTADSTQASGIKWGAAAGFISAVEAKTLAFTVTNADNGKLFECSGTFTVSFDALSTFDSTFHVSIRNTGTGTITLDPSTTEEIEIAGGTDAGDATITLPYSGSNSGPYNVSGVILYKSTVASTWGALTLCETHGQETFTANGTWICPKGVTTAWISGSGGGGAGGGTGGGTAGDDGVGGGGGAGVTTFRQRVSVVPGTSYSVTIGAGGSGVLGGTGNAGGTTSIGALVSLSGGAGGSATTAASPGTAGAGGGNGTGGFLSGDSARQGGIGGSTLFGAGGAGATSLNNGEAAAANTGAGGGGSFSTTSSRTGGPGGSGILTVEW